MKHKKAKHLLLASALAFSGGQAGALTVKDYDRADYDTQSRILYDVLHAYYIHYDGKDETKYVAQCMDNLYQPDEHGNEGRAFFNLVASWIKAARDKGADKFHVEDVLGAMIKNKCIDTDNIAKQQQNAPANKPG